MNKLSKMAGSAKRRLAPLRNFAFDAKERMQDVLFPTKDEDVLRAAKLLRKRIAELPPIDLRSGSAAQKKWNGFRFELRNLIGRRDPNRFLKWKAIRSTMALDTLPSAELDYLRSLPEWESWQHALKETKIGAPGAYKELPGSGINILHHAYSLAKLLSAFSIDFASLKHTVEIGGGYGSMCRLFYNKGYKGAFTVFDLAEFSALQEFFLSLVLSPEDFSRVSLVNEEKALGTKVPFDLFLATWSLSEMPVSKREAIVREVAQPRYVLIAYQSKFGEVDNLKYFEEFARNRPQYEWITEPINHLPGNYYLFGKLKNETR